MCELCRQYPCHPRCPNAEEPEPLGNCRNCSEELLPGEEVWTDVDGNLFCDKDCAIAFYGIREKSY